jgi:hypothetical protein
MNHLQHVGFPSWHKMDYKKFIVEDNKDEHKKL